MAATFDFTTFHQGFLNVTPFLYSLAVFRGFYFFLYCKDIPKATHKLDSFTQIIVLLIYRCNEDDIRQTNAQKNTYQCDTKANLY